MALLFGNNSSRNQPKNLVEFKAGKMSQKGNLVSPDKRKGLVYVYQSDDGLTHFCWKDRKSGTVEDDLIVFPDDCEYKKVSQCKDGSRIYLLKFKASARKLFFWMQESKSDGDEDLLWKVNDALNNPGGSGTRGGNGGQANQSGQNTPSENDMQALLSSMSQSQLMQLLGGMTELGNGGASNLLAQLSQHVSEGRSGSGSGGSTKTKNSTPAPVVASSGGSGSGGNSGGNTSTTTTPTTAKPPPQQASSVAPIQLQDLQKILSNIQPAATPAVDLSTGVSSELIHRISSSPTTIKKLAPLLPTFGFGGPSTEIENQVEETLNSPQFQSALGAFCVAFQSGQLAPLITQFGMGKEAINAAQSGNLEGFLNALQKEVEEEKGKSGNDAAEDMNVD